MLRYLADALEEQILGNSSATESIVLKSSNTHHLQMNIAEKYEITDLEEPDEQDKQLKLDVEYTTYHLPSTFEFNSDQNFS